MKKIFLAALALTAMFASCNKENQDIHTTPEMGDGPQVQISLKADDPASRAFFDNTASAEAWEKEITALSVYVFDAQGRNILRRNFTTSELSAASATFALPNSTAGTNCSFYVVANSDYGSVATVSDFDSRTETVALDEYNGGVNEVVMGRKRSSGFVMTGKNAVTIAPRGSSTNVAVSLKRLVAKIAVETKLAEDFTTTYNGGDVVITNATLSRANARSYSFPQSAIAKTTTYTHSQAPNQMDNYFGNLFFIYGDNAQGKDDDKVLLTLDGFFDADGLEATSIDRSEVRYTVLVNGAGNGEIKANGYYRIEATIKGLSGDGVTVNFTVADWETPVTQTVDLGV